MLRARAVLAVAMILCGAVVVTRMLFFWSAGLAIVPGIVLGAAMIALGAHRIALISRVRRLP